MAEIAEASNEQSKGIEQVSTAILEMDKVVQRNAANAEESASASEEMSAQAAQLHTYVGELVGLINGKKGLAAPEIRKTGTDVLRSVRKEKTVAATSPRNTLISSPQASFRPAKKNEVKPEEVIPFEDDFEEF